MIVVAVKEGENIERALKRFKRKFERTGAVKELRARKEFIKPSVLKRNVSGDFSLLKGLIPLLDELYTISRSAIPIDETVQRSPKG